MHRISVMTLSAAFVIAHVFLPAAAHEIPANVPEEARQLKNPLPGNGQTIQAGKAIYEKSCLTCHGARGKGDGPLAKSLHHPPPVFSKVLHHQTDGELHWKISRGGGMMPAFEKSLTEEERWQVVHYLRTLGKRGERQGR